MEDNDTDDYSLDENDENFDNQEYINDNTNTSFPYPYEVPLIIHNINHNQIEQWDLTLDPNHPDFLVMITPLLVIIICVKEIC